MRERLASAGVSAGTDSARNGRAHSLVAARKDHCRVRWGSVVSSPCPSKRSGACSFVRIGHAPRTRSHPHRLTWGRVLTVFPPPPRPKSNRRTMTLTCGAVSSRIRPGNGRGTSGKRWDGWGIESADQGPDSAIAAGNEIGPENTLKVETRVRTPLGLQVEGLVRGIRRKRRPMAGSNPGSRRFLFDESKFHGEGCSGSPKYTRQKPKAHPSALTMTPRKDRYRSGK
jgi:hypothetical protein